ncbi:MAG TPA: hypothetical protein VGM10_06340 [Actinocrinis sp.]
METTVWLTPGEAAEGVVKTITLPSGPVSVRIPPVGDNAVINVPTAEGEVSVRIRVSDVPPGAAAPTAQVPIGQVPDSQAPFGQAPVGQAPGAVPTGEEPTSQMPPPAGEPGFVPPFGAAASSPFGPSTAPPFGASASSPFDAGATSAFGAAPPPYGMPPYGMPPAAKPWYQKPGPWVAIGIVALVGTLIGFAVAGSPSPSPIVVANGSGTPTPTSGPTSTSSGYTLPTDTSTGEPTPTQPEDPTPTNSPLTAGQCLSGTLPTSSTPVSVTGVNVVDCSSPDASYKIIQTFPESDDLNDCNNVDSTQDVYAFSDEETWNGVQLWSAVYCAVQL